LCDSFFFDSLENVVDPWIANLWPVLAEVCQQKVSEGDQIEDITKGVSEVEISPMTAEEKAEKEPFSMTERRSTIPEVVAPYTSLANSLVKGDQINGDTKPATPLSHKIHVDTSALANVTQLTGLPRVPAAYIKLTKVEKNAEKPVKDKLPRFVYTPNPIIEATVSKVSCISRKGALKRTLHLELDLGEHTDFQPGDAFGVIAPNDEDLVQAVLERLGIKTAEEEMQQYSVEGDGKDIRENSRVVNELRLTDCCYCTRSPIPP
jgi:methionine synthase reductase